MKNKILLLIVLTNFFNFSSAIAQVDDTVSKDTLNTKSSTITGPGTINTGTSTNKGVLSADTAVSVFVLQAASGSDKEIQLGKLAQTRAQAKSVKSFAAKMIKDHMRANTELKKIALRKKIIIPGNQGGDKTAGGLLKNISGSDFDKAYMDMMVNDHEVTVGLFEKAATGLSDPEVRAFAEKMLPILKHHYDMAKALLEKLETNAQG